MTRRLLPITVLLLVMWGVLLIRVDAPWYGEQEASRAWIHAAVRNYDRYDVLIPIRNTAPGDPQYYSHHPPLMVWLPTATVALFGDHELAVRFGFIGFTLVSIAALYLLARRLYGARVAFWAALFYSVVPMTAYLGRVPGQSMPALAVGLLFGAVLVDWVKAPTRTRTLLLIALTFLAVWTAWVAVFFVGFMSSAALLLVNWRQRGVIVGLGLLSVVTFLLVLAFYQSQWSGAIESILNAFVWRTSSDSLLRGSEPFTMFDFLWRMFLHLVELITPALIFLAVIGLFALWRYGERRSNILWAGLLLAGLAYQLVFRNASYVHHYYKAFLLPALAIAAAMAWVYIRNHPRTRRVTRPALDALLLVTLLVGLGYTLILHTTGSQPWLDEVIAAINTRDDTPVVAQFVTDKPVGTVYFDKPVEFYTGRRIAWDVPPENVATRDAIIYIYCRENTLQPGLPYLQRVFGSPPTVTVYPDRCWLYDLEGRNSP